MQTTAIQDPQSENLSLYNAVRQVPEHALRKIEAGRLKGKSDINPMFRIMCLTREFGPAGFGWYTEVAREWTEVSESGETAVFIDINLYVKKDGEWSKPIHGTGGNKVLSLEKKWENGECKICQYLDDEAYKKAYTDAISVAAKALGIGADVYWEADRTKYGSFESTSDGQDTSMPVQGEELCSQSQWPWTKGFKEISPATSNWKASVTQVSKMNDLTADEILGRITSKFNITQENFNKLLMVANRTS